MATVEVSQKAPQGSCWAAVGRAQLTESGSLTSPSKAVRGQVLTEGVPGGRGLGSQFQFP